MKIHHIGYLVNNMQKSIEQFFSLGFEIERETMLDELRKVEIAFLINDGYRIELVSPIDKDSDVGELYKKYKDAPYHICYLSNNYKRDIDSLINEGYIVMNESKVAPALDGKEVIFLYKRNIGIIEIIDDKYELKEQ